MLDVLFDKNFFIGVVCVVVLFALIWLCVKYPSARLACFIIISIVYVALTTYCIVNLNIYYNAEGGIYGEITGLFSPTVSVEETSIQFNNLELVQYLDTDTYYCKIISDKVISVDENKNYQMYVNDIPCSNSKITNDYITCDYRYQFFDERENLLCDDVLQIRLVFNKNNSYFYISTENGTKSVNYWNYYINKNDFVLSIKEVDFASEDEITFASGTYENLYRVDYVYAENYTETKYYEANSHLQMKNLIGIKDWTVGEMLVSNDYVITSDLTVKANFYDFESIPMDIFTCELENGYLIGCLNAENVGLVYYKLDTQTYYFVSFYGYGWRGGSKLSDNVAGVASVYADVKSVIFDENSLSITILTISPDHYYAFSNGSTIEYVYSVNNQEGVYLYNVYENTITQIYADGYWTGFSGKFNELTGSGSTAVITGGSDTYYLKYDFITKKLVEIQYPADGDAIVGF